MSGVLTARVERVRSKSGNPDNDRFHAVCACGWGGTFHSNRTSEGRRLANRDAEQHRCRGDEGMREGRSDAEWVGKTWLKPCRVCLPGLASIQDDLKRHEGEA